MASVNARLLGPILRDVSRSFYLSIRLLPRDLREPIGLAYLLARSTDTLADTNAVPVADRRAMLEALDTSIQEGLKRNAIVERIGSFTALQTNMAERALLETLPHTLQLLEQTNAADRVDVRHVLARITKGQKLDLERFGGTPSLQALPTAADLDEYTFLVAGCVGDFWTRLCFRHVRNFSRESMETMAALGIDYGKGLQLLNILRDAHADLAAGRCYFPAEELRHAGLAPEEIVEQPEKFEPVYRKWIDTARRGLDAGMKYALSVDNLRVRAATALPALIGAKTLALLRAAGSAAITRRIKVPRAEVRRTILRMTLAWGGRQAFARMFEKANA